MEEVKQIKRTISRSRTPRYTFGQKVRLIRGKLQRFYKGHFKKGYVAACIEARKGECKRCGACCQLLFRCAFAAECKAGVGCKIYAKRPVNCRIFPLNRSDLKERDLVMPGSKCGYYFED